MRTARIAICWLLVVCSIICTGCMQVCSERVLEYSPVPVSQTVPVKAGMEALTDARPNKDVKALKDVPSIPEKLTFHMYKDFRDTNLFSDVLMPFETEKVDIIVRGKILELFWQNEQSGLNFIPYVGAIAAVCGAPTSTSKGNARIEISLYNARTGKLIATYVSGKDQEIAKTLYTPMKPSLGSELTNSISEAVGSIKKQIQADIEKIRRAVKK